MTLFGPEQAELFEVPEAWWVRRRCVVCKGTLARTHLRHETDPVWTYVMRRQWWLKIGKSYQPDIRRKVLAMPSPGCRVICPDLMDWSEPITIEALIPGDCEHELHIVWRELHAAGEWFLPDDAMLSWLEGVKRDQEREAQEAHRDPSDIEVRQPSDRAG